MDNLPIPLADKFGPAGGFPGNRSEKRLWGWISAAATSCPQLDEVIESWKHKGICCRILFLDASDATLIKRYKETRRSHPLAGGGRVDRGIEKERDKLAFLKAKADYIIDTSNLLTRELRQELEKIFVENEQFQNMFVTILSFGFKYGIPQDAGSGL